MIDKNSQIPNDPFLSIVENKIIKDTRKRPLDRKKKIRLITIWTLVGGEVFAGLLFLNAFAKNSRIDPACPIMASII
jgi:hypothetical protein